MMRHGPTFAVASLPMAALFWVSFALPLAAQEGAGAGKNSAATPAPGPIAQAQHPAIPVWLDRAEAFLRAESGTILTTPQGAAYVYYAPLAALWQIGAAAAAGPRDRPLAGQLWRDAEGMIFAAWEDGSESVIWWPDPLPFTRTGQRHALADLHDRLLATPLAGPLGDLPAGAEFLTDGSIVLPGPDTHLDPGLASGTAAPPPSPLWQSFGDHILITAPDGHRTRFEWPEITAALPPPSLSKSTNSQSTHNPATEGLTE